MNEDNFALCPTCGNKAVRLFFSLACDYCDKIKTEEWGVLHVGVESDRFIRNFFDLTRNEFFNSYGVPGYPIKGCIASIDGPEVIRLQGQFPLAVFFKIVDLQLAQKNFVDCYSPSPAPDGVFLLDLYYDLAHLEEVANGKYGDLVNPMLSVFLKKG